MAQTFLSVRQIQGGTDISVCADFLFDLGTDIPDAPDKRSWFDGKSMAGGGWGSSRGEGVLTAIRGGGRWEAPERLGQPKIGANRAAKTLIRHLFGHQPSDSCRSARPQQIPARDFQQHRRLHRLQPPNPEPLQAQPAIQSRRWWTRFPIACGNVRETPPSIPRPGVGSSDARSCGTTTWPTAFSPLVPQEGLCHLVLGVLTLTPTLDFSYHVLCPPPFQWTSSLRKRPASI
jgi:hypothetical protein